MQLNRKNQIIESIEYKFNLIEKQTKSVKNISSHKQIDNADKILLKRNTHCATDHKFEVVGKHPKIKSLTRFSADSPRFACQKAMSTRAKRSADIKWFRLATRIFAMLGAE